VGESYVDQAVELLEKANADLEPELLPAELARRLLASYARARKLIDFGIADLAAAPPGGVVNLPVGAPGRQT
jgi:hypothetical protein